MKYSSFLMVLCSIQAAQSADATTDDVSPDVACSNKCCPGNGLIIPNCDPQPCNSCGGGDNTGGGSNTGGDSGGGGIGAQPLCYNCQQCLAQVATKDMSAAE